MCTIFFKKQVFQLKLVDMQANTHSTNKSPTWAAHTNTQTSTTNSEKQENPNE